MSRISSRDTWPEKTVRTFLHKHGIRYRLNYKLFGKPDLVLPGRKTAVFIHGCFWHSHGCKNSVIPRTNRKFWSKKLQRNVDRDKEVSRTLKRKGWKVIVFWECEVNSTSKLNSLLRKVQRQ